MTIAWKSRRTEKHHQRHHANIDLTDECLLFRFSFLAIHILHVDICTDRLQMQTLLLRHLVDRALLVGHSCCQCGVQRSKHRNPRGIKCTNSGEYSLLCISSPPPSLHSSPHSRPQNSPISSGVKLQTFHPITRRTISSIRPHSSVAQATADKH